MKVIIIENENFTRHRIGGISSYIRGLMRVFEKNMIDYCCVGAGWLQHSPATLHSSIENTSADLQFRAGEELFDRKLYSISEGSLSNARFCLKLFLQSGRLFRKMEGVVFHFQHPYMTFVLRSLRLKNSFVLTLHSKQDLSFRDKRDIFSALMYDFITRLSLRYYNFIIADNAEVLQYYHKKYGMDLHLATVIPPPVDLEVFKPLNKPELRKKYHLNENDKMILYAGRIEKEKNLELLIRSYRMLLDEIPQLKLWIVGEGAHLMPLKYYAQKHDLLDVAFMKTLPPDELAEVMNCADVLAITSLHEGGPIVVKEALACNLAVVSVNVGDVAGVLEGLEGCFVASYDENDFSGCLRKAVLPHAHYNLREAVYRYGIEEFGVRVVRVYKGCFEK